MSGQWIAKSCGSKDNHDQHIWVQDKGFQSAKAFSCAGYTQPVCTTDKSSVS